MTSVLTTFNVAKSLLLALVATASPAGQLLASEPFEFDASQHASWLIAAAAGETDVPGSTLQPSFNRAAYNPAVLHLRFTQASGKTTSKATDAFLDLTLIPSDGEVEGRRVELSTRQFGSLLRQLYQQLSRQDFLDEANPDSATRQLHQLLIGSISPLLDKYSVSTLLISADRGLQGVPFAALSDGQRFFGDRYAFAITPSLALTDLDLPTQTGNKLLALGASQFEGGLASLPLVPQELEQIAESERKDLYFNKAFTPSSLLVTGGESRYSRVHVATHAEFRPGGPAASQLHSGTGPISLDQLSKLRQQRKGVPIDLVVLSACRTALGDPDSELGFAGLALQAGARSAVGTLWYVDDVVTSAYFIQMYRYLDQDIPKAEALQLTRQGFLRGLVTLEDDQVIGVDGTPLLRGLTMNQQRRVVRGMKNPFFWAGIELIGSPW